MSICVEIYDKHRCIRHTCFFKSMTSPSLTQETHLEKKQPIAMIIRMLNRTYPDTTLALNFTNPLELLIALILAAQCTDILVNQVTAPLFEKYRTA